MKQYLNTILAILVLQAACLHAARGRSSYEEERNIITREILDSLDSLRYEVNNHEAEIRMFEEKFKNQEDILDTIRKQTNTSMQAVKGQTVNVEAKLAGHENASKGLLNDFKSYAKETTQAMTEYKDRLSELEKTIELQNRNIENLQAAMRTLMEALQSKDNVNSTADAKVYRVKAGDSLEKIAKQNQTTIKKLKELNNLNNDQIIINQKLKIPE